MEKIKSFTIDHTKLLPGVYVSREDAAENGAPVTTYDIRLTRPNFEPVMGTGEVHTIEHIGATYLRNRADVKDRVIYWGPMGCRTGFYLIMAGAPVLSEVEALMRDLFAFTAAFEGDVPGATPVECGNYSDMDLPAAKARAETYGAILQAGAWK